MGNSWEVGVLDLFLPSWKILSYSNIFSRKGRTTYKVGILNFLKAPFASEDSICAEYHFLLLPCYRDLLKDAFSSEFEKKPQGSV